MGGGNSEITDRTETSYSRAPNLSALHTEDKLALGMRTDASSSFEKGLDP